MIDLHTHTTASDGRSSPEVLVQEAVAAGITTLAVTDHDTVAGLVPVAAAASVAGLRFVPGIEITAVHEGRDVHVLGYFVRAASKELQSFLEQQRADRRRRLVEIIARLEDLGVSIDSAPLLARAAADTGKAIGRPLVAEALVTAGHAKDVPDAFERFLAAARPAFIERQGASPDDVIGILARAGAVSSLAHPGKTGVDAHIPRFVDAGLSAIEVYHPDHDHHAKSRYRAMASRFDVLVTGGSDYHGLGSGRADAFGHVGVPERDFEQLEAHATR